MRDLIAEITCANTAEIGDLLKAVKERYAVLFPGWEIITVSLEKTWTGLNRSTG